MIKNDSNFIKVSLDTILGEIINISSSLGECKSSISHVESSIHLLTSEIKKSLNEIDSRLHDLEKDEYARTKRKNFIWKLLTTSPFDIFKWLLTFGIVGYFISLSLQVNFIEGFQKIYQLMVK